MFYQPTHAHSSIPEHIYHQMLANNLISATIGFIPLVGDVMLAVYKANSRNAALLEAFLRERAAQLQKEIEEAQQAAQQLSDTQAQEQQARPAPKKEGSWWSRRRGKSGSGKSTGANGKGKPPVHRPTGSGDSRFVEAVS